MSGGNEWERFGVLRTEQSHVGTHNRIWRREITEILVDLLHAAYVERAPNSAWCRRMDIALELAQTPEVVAKPHEKRIWQDNPLQAPTANDLTPAKPAG